jgi:hypothetical protein
MQEASAWVYQGNRLSASADGMLSPSVSDASENKAPTHSAPHGIGGEAIRIVGIVIVGRTVSIHIAEIVGVARVRFRKHPAKPV